MQTFHIQYGIGGHYVGVNIICLCFTDFKVILQLCLIMDVYRDAEVMCYTLMY